MKKTWLRQSYRPNRKVPSYVSTGSSSGGVDSGPQGSAGRARKNPARIRPGTALMGAGQKVVLFHILLHQWLENFYLTSANIGNRKMNSAEFHK